MLRNGQLLQMAQLTAMIKRSGSRVDYGNGQAPDCVQNCTLSSSVFKMDVLLHFPCLSPMVDVIA